MANYSGNLIRTYARSDEQAGSFNPDPAHAITDTPEEYGAVHQVPANTGMEYDGTAFPDDVAVGGGSVLATPRRSHSGLAGRRMVYTDDQAREGMALRHQEDGQRGYVRARYTLPPLQDTHEVYSDEYYEGNLTPTTPNNSGAVSVLRGINGVPQNNPPTLMYPDGVRPGVIRGWLMRSERRLGRRKYAYDAQPLYDRSTYQDANVPAPAGADPMAAGSVLDSWQPAAAFSRIKTPALFRTPPTVDESSLAAEQSVSSDVIGGSL